MQIRKWREKLSINDKIVLRNTLAAFAIKGLALVISLLTTPAFIRYFNNNMVLGVWYTMLSVLLWFLNFDLGIGNGVRNNLTVAFAVNDRKRAKEIMSSGLAAVSGVTVLLTIVGILLLSLMDLNKLFNISGTTISGRAIFISSVLILVAIMLRFMLTTVSSIFYALQKSSVNNFISLWVSILQLLYVQIFHFDDPETGLIALAAAYMIVSNLPTVIAAVAIFCRELRDCVPSIHCVRICEMRGVLKVGGIFFLCQILYMCIMNTNEFLITGLFSPQYTTEYTFYYKITSLISMVVSLAMTPLWSMITKVIADGDWLWLKKLYHKIKIVGAVVIVAEFLAIPFLQPLMNLWLGKGTLVVDYSIALAFSCFGSVFVYSSMLSTIVCGMARMRLQAICYFVGIVFKFIFVFTLSKITDNWSVVVWSNALLLLPYCILQQIDLNILIKKQCKLYKNKTE